MVIHIVYLPLKAKSLVSRLDILNALRRVLMPSRRSGRVIAWWPCVSAGMPCELYLLPSLRFAAQSHLQWVLYQTTDVLLNQSYLHKRLIQHLEAPQS